MSESKLSALLALVLREYRAFGRLSGETLTACDAAASRAFAAPSEDTLRRWQQAEEGREVSAGSVDEFTEATANDQALRGYVCPECHWQPIARPDVPLDAVQMQVSQHGAIHGLAGKS